MRSTVLIIDGESYFAAVGKSVILDHLLFLQELEDKLKCEFTSKTFICEETSNKILTLSANKSLSEKFPNGPEYTVEMSGIMGISSKLLQCGLDNRLTDRVVLITTDIRLLQSVQILDVGRKGFVEVITSSDCLPFTSQPNLTVFTLLDKLIKHHTLNSIILDDFTNKRERSDSSEVFVNTLAHKRKSTNHAFLSDGGADEWLDIQAEIQQSSIVSGDNTFS
jgi:hypothetical protein